MPQIVLFPTRIGLAVALACLLAMAPAITPAITYAQQGEPIPASIWSLTGGSSDSLGELVVGIGDVNGDGYADAMAGGAGEFNIFLGGENGLADQPDFTADDLSDGDFFFPYAFAAAGDVNGDGFSDIIAGAPYDTESSGAVKLYYGAADGFAETPWSIYGADPGDELGAAVAGAGDINGDGFDDVLIAAPGGYDSEIIGSVFVYHGSADGLRDEPATTLTGRETDTLFGDQVAAAGDVNGDGYGDILVSIGGADVAMLYYGSSDSVESMPAHFLTPEEYDYIFAYSLTGVGDVNGDGYDDVLVDAANIDDTLKAYVYYGSEEGLAEAADARLVVTILDYESGTVRAAGDLNGDGYDDVAFSVVTPGYEETGSGTVYIYTGSADGIGESPTAMINGTEAGDEFGWELSAVGDMDGDGLGDLLIGAPSSTEGGDYAGKAYLFSGASALDVAAVPLAELGDMTGAASDTTPATSADNTGSATLPMPPSSIDAWSGETTILSGGEPGEAFGWPTSIAGDVNGDGFDDLLVNSIGNPDLDIPPRALLYLGSADGVETEPAWEQTRDDWPLPAQMLADGFTPLSFSLSGVGDINGDGLDDVALSIIELDAGFGLVLLYPGSADGLSADPVWQVESDAEDLIFGAKVRGAGDINGDGFADLLLLHVDGDDEQFAAELYHGSADDMSDEPAWRVDELDPFQAVGMGFAAPGDVDGDGFDDLLIGAPGFPGGDGMGMVDLYRGSEDGLQTSTAWSQVGAGFENYAGLGLAALGDVNGDGADEFALSMPGYNDWQGGVTIYTTGENGLSTGLSDPAPQTLEGDFPQGYFGVLLAGPGDVNGDGFADLLVGNVDEEGEDSFLWQLHLGSEEGILDAPVFSVRTPSADEFTMLFQQVEPGDLNGDGYNDMVFSDVDIEALEDGEAFSADVTIYYGSEITDSSEGTANPAPVSGSALLPDATPTGDGAWQLVAEEPLDFYPFDVHSLSPDGQWLLLDEWGEQLCIYSADTFEEEHCTAYAEEFPNGYAYEELTWSPDSRYIAFTEDVLVEWEDSDVWVLNVVEGGFENLTDDDFSGTLDDVTEPVLVDVAPAWSSDGGRILFARDVIVDSETQQTSLYTFSASANEPELLMDLDTDTLLPIWTGMRYAPDDETILYTYFAEETDDPLNGIWRISADGQPEQILGSDPLSGPPTLMAVDPTGTWALVYYLLADSLLYDEDGNVALDEDSAPIMTYALLNLEDGSAAAIQPEALADGQYAMLLSATFSPDGSTLLFTYAQTDDLAAMLEDAVEESAETVYVLAARSVDGSDGRGDTILMTSDEELGHGYLSESRLNWAANNRVYVPTYAGGYLLELSER